MLQTFLHSIELIRGTGMPIKMKVCNVADYNDSLKKRGRVFHLFDEATKVWFYKPSKSRRSKYTYSDRLIETLAVLRYLFKYPYRQLEGLLEDYIRHKNLQLPIPDFTTLCRRMTKLELTIVDHRNKNKMPNEDLIDVVVDSTGINIYHTGGGHSKENSDYRQHRHLDQVRKMHIAYNPKKKKVISMILSSCTTADGDMVGQLLGNIGEKIGSIYADGAYDRTKVRKVCLDFNARQIIPPMKTAVKRKTSKEEPSHLWDERNAAIKSINRYKNKNKGLKRWKMDNNYGIRSLIEAFFGKFKAVFGFHFMNRKDESREKELMVKINILNSFTELGGAVFKKAV